MTRTLIIRVNQKQIVVPDLSASVSRGHGSQVKVKMLKYSVSPQLGTGIEF